MKIILILLGIIMVCPLLAMEPQVGFVWHYPYEDKYTEDLDGMGVNVMNSRIPWVVFEPREGEYDFSTLDKQLKTARRYGFRLILIIEFNPFCKPAWLYDKCKAADEVTMQFDGVPGYDNMPSLNSPILKQAQEKLMQKLADYLKEHDSQHTVIGYEAGVEWWHFAACRYNRLDTALFGPWLQRKYAVKNEASPISALNSTWNTAYDSFDEIEAPAVGVNIGGDGTAGTGNVYVQIKEPRNIAWYNNEPEPYSGRQLTLSVKADNHAVFGLGTFITIAWFEKGSYIPIASSNSECYIDEGEKLLTVTSERPENAVGFSIYFLLVGYGNVKWSDVHIIGDTGEIKLPASRIVFDPRTKTEDARGEYADGVWTIGTKEYTGKNVSPGAVYDYQEFWQDMSAEYLNSLAAMVKKYDKSRFLMSFLTHSFSMSAEWDYNINAGFVPDKVFAAGKDLDILGMQLVGAEGDPYRIAAGMDLGRKYNKPLCNIDLMDFNGGIYVPMKLVKQMAHTSIMHGTDHIMFCNYEGPAEMGYRPDYPVEEIKDLIKETRLALETVKDYKPRPKVCIINPFILPVQDCGTNDSRSLMGWYKILEDRQIECDVMTFEELKHFDLSKYEAVILPDAGFMTDEAYKKLSEYKGCLLAVKGAGSYDPTGRKREPLSGKNIVFTEDYGRQFAGDAVRHRRAGDTPAMMQIRELSEEQLKGLRRGIAVLSGLQKDVIRTSRNSRVMRMYDKNGRLLVYVMNTSGEENTVLSANDAEEIITEKGKSDIPVFDSFCILKY